MANILLINGCGGSGKESVSKALLARSRHGAWLDIKALTRVEPWEFGGEVANLGLRNAGSLICNFIDAGHDPVIFSGGISNQESLNFLDALAPLNHPRHFIWLDVSKETRDARRIQRCRDEADKRQYLDQIDSVYSDPGELSVPHGTYHRVHTGDLSPEGVADEILRSIELNLM